MKEFDEDECMNNSYLLVTGKKTIKQFLDSGKELWFLHNPDEELLGKNHPVYDELIEYFITTEEYEKCEEILVKKNITKVLN
jgi:hypothetical protein|tara:strand:+ start:28052 stop:28297 length:246 start_codon:yes stop_codon:yes gene_type:complete